MGFSPALASARLTFWGRPVQGSRGISADFGTEAVRSFSKAVTNFCGGQGIVVAGPGADSGRIQLSGNDYRSRPRLFQLQP